jgi:small subunit ribosomal protein S20
MANTKSAQKATRVIAKRTEINKARRSRLRTTLGKLEDAFATGDRSKVADALKDAEPALMRAAQQGVLHRNAASRKVARLSKRLQKLGA